MIIIKSLKWGFGIIALSLGLSACMDMQQRPEHSDAKYYEKMNAQNNQAATTKTKPQPKQKTYPSKDPTQQATPGPARQAAPQIPVIQ